MEPERWRRLKELVLAALERAPAEREDWIRRAAENEALAEEAIRLIEHDGGSSPFDTNGGAGNAVLGTRDRHEDS